MKQQLDHQAEYDNEVKIPNVCEAKRSVTVHGVVLHFSLVKNKLGKLGMRKWFDGQICDGKSVVRMVFYNANIGVQEYLGPRIDLSPS